MLSPAEEWTQVADGQRVLPILRTLPGEVIGPGHNSVVRGPDNLQAFCIYHRWTQELSARVLAIDPLDWVGDRLTVLGPTTTPQSLSTPTFAGWFDRPESASLGDPWRCTGNWISGDGAAKQQEVTGVAEAELEAPASAFVCEVSLRALNGMSESGTMGLRLRTTTGSALHLELAPDRHKLRIGTQIESSWHEQDQPLPPDFDPLAYHLLRLIVDGTEIRFELDTKALHWHGRIDAPVTHLALVTRNMSAAFAGFALTVGWEDLFTDQQPDAELAWQPADGSEGWQIEDQQLWYAGRGDHAVAVKGPLLTDYELVVNARLESRAEPNGCYGLYPARTATNAGPLLTVVQQDSGWVLQCVDRDVREVVPLPPGFDPHVYQQLRLRKQGGRLRISLEATPLTVIDVSSEGTNVGLYGHQAVIAWDMVRVTALTP